MPTAKKPKQKRVAKSRKPAARTTATKKRAVASKRKPAAKKRVRLAIPPKVVKQAALPAPRRHSWVHRVEAALASLLLLLIGVTANAAVVIAAGRDMRAAEAQTAFVIEAYKQPKEYLYDRATEKDLDYKLLERIAFCESNWRMVKSSKSSAYGFFQIIDGTERHTPSFKNGERKFDAQTNIDMAVYLYDRYGAFPWDESRPCWKSSLK